MMDLSIAIINWNTKYLLKDCLKSIYSKAHKISLEILVMDNDSSDGSREMIKGEFSQVRLVPSRKRCWLEDMLSSPGGSCPLS